MVGSLSTVLSKTFPVFVYFPHVWSFRPHYFFHQLLKIRPPSHNYFDQFLINPESFLEILVGEAAALHGALRRGRQCADVLMKMSAEILHCAPFQSPGQHPLSSKQWGWAVALFGLSRTHSAALYFTETWFSERTLDAALNLLGFQLHCVDHIMALLGKLNGMGICF